MEEVYSDTAPEWKVLACRAGTQGQVTREHLMVDQFLA